MPCHIFTAADLAELPAELPTGPVRYELDNGRLITMSPPAFGHGRLEAKIAARFYEAGDLRGFGKVCCGETGVVLWRDPDRVVGVDVAFIAAASLPVRLSPEGYLETIPQLIVEIVSKNDSAPSVLRKVEDYLQAGVVAVWIVDPFAQPVTEHRRGVPPKVFTAADTLAVEDIIPGMRWTPAELFAD